MKTWGAKPFDMDEKAISRPPSSTSKKDGSGNEAVEIDPVKVKALVRKVDRHIVPFLVLLYLFSFLDRGKFPNAPIARLRHIEECITII